jgi:DNA-binding beta-propeller fold protein YncE
MSTRLDNFAARLGTQLHASLDGIPLDDMPWVDAHANLTRRQRHRRRQSWAKAAATVLAAAAAVTLVIVVTQPGARSAAHPVAPSQPQILKVVATAAVGGSAPAPLAAGGGWVFAGLWDSGQVLRLDPATLHTTATLQVGTARNGPLSIAYGAGALWVLNFADGRLWRVDPATMTTTLKVTLPSQPSQVAVGDGAVWVTVCCTSSDASTRQRLLRIDAATGAITGSHDVSGDGETVPLAVGPDVVVTSHNGPVLVIDPNTMKVVRTLPDLCNGCEETAGLVAGGQGIYLTSSASVVRYDLKTGRLLATSPEITDIGAPLDAQPNGIWFSGTSRVLRLDPTSLAITAEAPVSVGGYLVQLADSIYISTDGTIEELGPAS